VNTGTSFLRVASKKQPTNLSVIAMASNTFLYAPDMPLRPSKHPGITVRDDLDSFPSMIKDLATVFAIHLLFDALLLLHWRE
jgi:hypothetical protein